MNWLLSGKCRWIAFVTLASALAMGANAQQRWSEAQADAWYAAQPWPVGANFVPSTAINELEMWQADTFDAKTTDRELGWAEAAGMNTMRVFLHNLLWEQDPKGFEQRIDTFLSIAARHHIRPIFVLFDSCWEPFPKLGPQHPPIPGVHNSGWVQAPGAEVLADPKQYPRLENYVKGVVGAFADDPRILAWDLWNEPDNGNGSSYAKGEPRNKNELVLALLPQVFAWARTAHPRQPLTSGLWHGDWASLDTMPPLARVQIEQSDVISFHNYGWPEEFEMRVKQLEQFHRPLICTEYMARGAGSLFDTILPIAHAHRVGAINWGLVAGKTQTYLPWDSWQRPYVNTQPTVWFHDVFHPDGKPYREREIEIIRNLTSMVQTPPAAARPARAAPPVRDPKAPGFVSAKELEDGANAPASEDGNFIIGPTHNAAMELTEHEGVPKGTVYEFTMNSADSQLYPGVARDADTYGAPDPADPGKMVVTTSHPAPYTRRVAVYVPQQYVPGTAAPFIVGADGPDRGLFTALDNLIAVHRVPAMIAISIGNGSGDAQGSERGLEYDTMSGRYAEFVETEVLPLVEKRYHVKLTRDPDGRATMGGSSGGSCALIMAWYHPELYHRVLTYSGTYVNQQWPYSAETPHGAWEFHEHLIPNSARKPLRLWMEVGDRDLFNPNTMRDNMHDWTLANENMAKVLAAKGYHYQFVFARNAGHTDGAVKRQTLPEALEYLWQGYRAGRGD